MFPFNIKYKTTIPANKDFVTDQAILLLFHNDLKEGGVNELSINGNRLNFKNEIFAFRRCGSLDLWAGVPSGYFEIISEKETRKVEYSFSAGIVLVLGVALGLLFGIAADWYSGLIIILFLGVLNWFIVLIRHKIKLRKLVNKIIDNGP